jgi:hypothetical protein
MEKKDIADGIIGNMLGIAAIGIGAILVTRVVKKQTLAAEMRKEDPGLSYHQSIVSAFHFLGYDSPNPFKF